MQSRGASEYAEYGYCVDHSEAIRGVYINRWSEVDHYAVADVEMPAAQERCGHDGSNATPH